MNTREYALMIFTILAQLAVGMLLVQLLVRALAVKKDSPQPVSRLLDLSVYAVVPVMALALLASLFHLGKVTHVIGAVPNLGTSWMSREVVLAVVFFVLAALYTYLHWRKSGSEELRAFFGWLAALVGLGMVFAMSMTYLLPAQPAMNTAATPLLFYTATLLMGALGFAAALMAAYGRLDDKEAAAAFLAKTLQWVALAAIVLLGVEFLVMPVYLAYLSTQGSAALKSLEMMVGQFGFVFALRLVLVFAGAGVLGAYLYKQAALPDGSKAVASFVYSAFVLVLLGELLGRFLFYATTYRIGI